MVVTLKRGCLIKIKKKVAYFVFIFYFKWGPSLKNWFDFVLCTHFLKF